MNTTRRMQDHDFTLFPDRRYKLFLGYSRNLETGPALTTMQLFNAQGNEYPLFENVHRQVNEYRLGGEAHRSRHAHQCDAWVGGFPGEFARIPDVALDRK